MKRLAAAASLVAVLVVPASPAGASRHHRHRCPSTDAGSVVSHRAGAGRVLVPRGARSVVICAYRGAGVGSGMPDPLRAARVVRRRGVVRRLVSELDVIQPDPPGSVHSCPADRGEGSLRAYFRYARGPANPVAIRLGGCRPATNGVIDRIALSPSGVTAVNDLRRLVHLN